MRAIKKALTFLLAAILIATSSISSIADGPCDCTYIVQPGDNIIAIAQKLGVTTPALLAANKQITNPNVIYVGQRLIIPNCPKESQRAHGDQAPIAPPIPVVTHYVQPGEDLWEISTMYSSNPFALLDLNELRDIELQPGQPLLVPQGKPKSPTPPFPMFGDYLIGDGKLPDAIPGKWGVPYVLLWVLTGGIQGSDNPAIRLEKAYPPVPDQVGWWPEPRHPLDKSLPRYRQRITCWRIAQREASQPGGQRPCWCGRRDNGDGTVSYAFYFCEGPNITTSLLTGGKWIKDILMIVNVGVSSEGVDMYQQSTALSEPGKILDQFEEIPCPELEEVIKMALEAGAKASTN